MTTDVSEKGLETLIVSHMTSPDGGWLARRRTRLRARVRR